MSDKVQQSAGTAPQSDLPEQWTLIEPMLVCPRQTVMVVITAGAKTNHVTSTNLGKILSIGAVAR
ncbi:hypothetical protein PI124_g8226 [Phytophthora idaei]|nr:hypothetical protein PI125_g9245 [Phytophthora idaei]KAG3157661.1 hypothetical protein PI126_g8188 [Phytophthora idaei]KAG3247078.1 hypothetical protein PI124_g8226 [Phytophthora idaei]